MNLKKTLITLSFSLAGLCGFAQNNALKTSIDKGKIVFEGQCLACHQADGGGVPNLNPPLIKTSFVLGDKKKLIGIVLKGLEGVDVGGESYSNPMPGLDFLTDEEIANVLTYVRNSFGNKASQVTVAEVQKVRAAK